jgi:hypothetical protein
MKQLELRLKTNPLRFHVDYPDGTAAELPLSPAAAQHLALALAANAPRELLPEVKAAIGAETAKLAAARDQALLAQMGVSDYAN